MLNFKIKLLSGNNVVLVDCMGYESELFVPQIVKGRITFQNILPSHRCCGAAADNVQTGSLLSASKLGDVRVVAGARTPQRSGCNVFGPLAKSTPSSDGTSMRSAIRTDKENVSPSTPEKARCKPSNMSASPISICIDDILPTLETSATSMVPNPALSSMNTPAMRPASCSISGLTPRSEDTVLCNFMHKAPPVRTYARPNTSGTAKAPISWSPIKKKKQSKMSSTKPPSPTIKLDVRHRKLIVDRKKTLAPLNAKNAKLSISKTQIQSRLVSGKTRQEFEALQVTAFDLLTLPCVSNISAELSNQFKEACTQKYSETIPSYAELSGAAPLQIDRQVKSLMAKEKRLERQMSKAERLRLQTSKRI